MVVSEFYCVPKQHWTKDTRNAEEAGKAIVKYCVDMGTDENLVGQDQIGNTNNDDHEDEKENKNLAAQTNTKEQDDTPRPQRFECQR